MAEDGRTTLGKLSRGDVFRTADGLLWRRTGIYPSAGPELVYCERVGANAASSQLRADLEVEPLDLPALLSELAELRTLAHDLLLDRDAAYGREVGRGEAAALARRHMDEWQEASTQERLKWGPVRGLERYLSDLEALGPVRPLPQPERLAARCRALETALRDLARAVEDLEGVDQISWSPQGQAARKAAIGAYELLKEISAEK